MKERKESKRVLAGRADQQDDAWSGGDVRLSWWFGFRVIPPTSLRVTTRVKGGADNSEVCAKVAPRPP